MKQGAAVVPAGAGSLLGPDMTVVLRGRAEAISGALGQLEAAGDRIAAASTAIVESLANGHLVLACGNGGSAAEAQHFVGELVGRFLREREPWPAMALTTDTSILTSIANDYGYESVFARQVAAFGHPGDILVAFSTSGKSPNVIRGVEEAHDRGLRVIALTGSDPGPLGALADITLAVPLESTPLVQEVHTILVHLICESVESTLADGMVERNRT